MRRTVLVHLSIPVAEYDAPTDRLAVIYARQFLEERDVASFIVDAEVIDGPTD